MNFDISDIVVSHTGNVVRATTYILTVRANTTNERSAVISQSMHLSTYAPCVFIIRLSVCDLSCNTQMYTYRFKLYGVKSPHKRTKHCYTHAPNTHKPNALLAQRENSAAKTKMACTTVDL